MSYLPTCEMTLFRLHESSWSLVAVVCSTFTDPPRPVPISILMPILFRACNIDGGSKGQSAHTINDVSQPQKPDDQDEVE